MKSHFVFLMGIVLVIFSHCENSTEPVKDNPYDQFYHAKTDEIDINSDGFPDLRRETGYYTYGGKTLEVFYLNPLTDALVLCLKYNQPTFLSKNDTVFCDPKEPDFWRSQSINTMDCVYYNTDWNGWWAGRSGYIGVKVKQDSLYFLSWVLIHCDTLRENNIIFLKSSFAADPQTDFIIR